MWLTSQTKLDSPTETSAFEVLHVLEIDTGYIYFARFRFCIYIHRQDTSEADIGHVSR